VTRVDDSPGGPAHVRIEYRAGIERPLKAAEAVGRDIVHEIVVRGSSTDRSRPVALSTPGQHP
jgi:hypothetical protein